MNRTNVVEITGAVPMTYVSRLVSVRNRAETAGSVMSVTATPSVMVRHARVSGRMVSGNCLAWAI